MNFQAFDHYVEQHQDQILAQLIELCRIPSTSVENGPAMAEARDLVLDLCAGAGVATEVVPQDGGPAIVVGRAGTGPRRLMMYNHYDVQPPEPLDEWTSPPFQPELRDGKLFARGSSDNKGDLVARLWAVRAYQETIGPLPVELFHVIEGEEEVGSLHLASFARANEETLRQIDGCLWEYGYTDAEYRPVVNLGVKGILAVDLWVRTASTDAHSGNGGLMPNAAWRLVEALNTLRSADGTVTVDGLQDHVRLPSPEELVLAQGLPWDGETLLKTYGVGNGFLGGMSTGRALQRLLFEPALTINGLLGGYTGPGSKTVIPAQATAKLDFRLVPDLTPDLVLDLLRGHLSRRGFDDVEVRVLEDGLMPARTAPNAAIVRAVSAALEEVYARPPVIYPTSGGSGPMYELCQAYGIDVASAGVGWYGSRAHAPDESVRVADFFAGIRWAGRLFDRFARA